MRLARSIHKHTGSADIIEPSIRRRLVIKKDASQVVRLKAVSGDCLHPRSLALGLGMTLHIRSEEFSKMPTEPNTL